MARILAFTAVMLFCACAPNSVDAAALTGASARTRAVQAPAPGAHAVRLTASFSPERLGAGTTLSLGFEVAARAGQIPSALTEVELFYPAELGLGTSDLGLETCLPARLQADGLAGCPANSRMGYGSGLVEVALSTDVVLEHVSVTVISAPVQDGHLGLLFFASGEVPVLAELVFPGFVLPAQAQFGGLLAASLPLVPSVPGGPDAALVRLQTTLGPRHITYYERVKGKTVAFHPEGIRLPTHCPRGGFPFAVRLSFQDGTSASADTAVPCPRGA
jgi:hypothetical protein